MKATESLALKAKAELIYKENSDFINDRTNEINHFVRELAISENLREQLSIFFSWEALELASDGAEIQDLISNLCAEFTKRAACAQAAIEERG